MTVVYIDEVFLLNIIIDYLLLLASAKLTGEVICRPRLALAAGLGGLYAAVLFLPGWGFLEQPPYKIALPVAMALIAFGNSRRLLRVSLVFLGVSAAFGGGVLALQLFLGAPAVLDLKTTLLAAVGCYLFITLIFRRGARHSGRELTTAELQLEDHCCRMMALVDTGNTLTDPITGKPVMVAEGEKLRPLFPKGACPTADELMDPIAALEQREGNRFCWRLVPYRAVGVPWGMLLAVKVDKEVVGKEDYGAILVALSPTPLSDGGGYSDLIGA